MAIAGSIARRLAGSYAFREYIGFVAALLERIPPLQALFRNTGMAKKSKPYGNRWQTIKTITEGGQAQIFLVKDKAGEYAELCVLKRVGNTAATSRRSWSGTAARLTTC
jgi:hypothetical protein